jgi:hypothetical protein
MIRAIGGLSTARLRGCGGKALIARLEIPARSVPSPGTACRLPSGSRTARLSLRVDTVDQHQIHRPAAKPILGLGRRPTRKHHLAAVETAHPGTMHPHLATVETDFALGPAPAGPSGGRGDFRRAYAGLQ